MSDLAINAVDIVVLAVLAISAIFAFMRGFVHEVLAIGAWVGAILVTLYGFPHIQPYAREIIAIDLLADILGGVAIFLVVLVVLAVFTRMLSGRVQRSSLGALDRSLGLVFGLLRGVVIVAAAWLVMTWAIPDPDERPQWVQEAKSKRLVEISGEVLASALPEHLQQDGRNAAGSARRSAERANEVNEVLDFLPRIAPADEAPEESKGYGDAPRRDMDRLLENLTGSDNEGG